MSKRLDGKVTVIVGGASGMGSAMSPIFAAAGARVIIADLDESAARAVEGYELAVGVDVTDEESVRQLAERVESDVGPVDAVVNTVGFAEFVPATEITYEAWRNTIDINLSGVFLSCREFGKRMVERRRGKIVNFASTGGLTGVPGMAHYTAAKHGIVGLTRVLAVEWGKYNVHVNCICPGATATPMLMSVSDEAWRAKRIARIPLLRLGKPEEQARTAMFLISDDSDYLTGAMLTTDGGVSAMAAGTGEEILRNDD